MMKLDIIKEKDIPLLKRKRVTMMYNSQDQKTPSRVGVLQIVAKKLGSKEDSITIRHIYPQFGSSSSKIIAHVYKDKKTMDMYEHKSLIDKHVETQSSKAASADEPEPKEEKAQKPAPALEGEAQKEEGQTKGGEETQASEDADKPIADEAPAEEKKEEPKQEEAASDEKQEKEEEK